MKHDPKRTEALQALPPPVSGADLKQLVCACGWMRASIPRYNELVSKLTLLMELCMSKGGSRKKNKLVKLLLEECGWIDVHEEEFARLKGAVAEMVPLAHPKEDADVCVYTDASQDHWGAVVTQLKPGELDKPKEEQNHEPLAFLSGSFKGSASRWPRCTTSR